MSYFYQYTLLLQERLILTKLLQACLQICFQLSLALCCKHKGQRLQVIKAQLSTNF